LRERQVRCIGASGKAAPHGHPIRVAEFFLGTLEEPPNQIELGLLRYRRFQEPASRFEDNGTVGVRWPCLGSQQIAGRRAGVSCYGSE